MLAYRCGRPGKQGKGPHCFSWYSTPSKTLTATFESSHRVLVTGGDGPIELPATSIYARAKKRLVTSICAQVPSCSLRHPSPIFGQAEHVIYADKTATRLLCLVRGIEH